MATWGEMKSWQIPAAVNQATRLLGSKRACTGVRFLMADLQRAFAPGWIPNSTPICAVIMRWKEIYAWLRWG